MLSDAIKAVFAAVMYIAGILVVNSFAIPIQRSFALHPAMELAIVSVAVFLLSSLFYGRFSILVLVFAGAYFGAGFAVQPIYSLLATIPMAMAYVTGSQMGEMANFDLKGKADMTENVEDYAIRVAAIVVISAIIGLLSGYIAGSWIIDTLKNTEFYKQLIPVKGGGNSLVGSLGGK